MILRLQEYSIPEMHAINKHDGEIQLKINFNRSTSKNIEDPHKVIGNYTLSITRADADQNDPLDFFVLASVDALFYLDDESALVEDIQEEASLIMYPVVKGIANMICGVASIPSIPFPALDTYK